MKQCLQLAVVEPTTLIVWNSIEIEDRWEEEERQYIASENAIYAKLGLEKEDEMFRKRRERACDSSAQYEDDLDAFLAAMPVGDLEEDEIATLYDKRNPVMKPGNLYPSMQEF